MSQETKPNTTINLQHSKRQPFNLTATDQAEIELLSLCQNIGAPLYAYDAIMKWACDASLRGHVFTPGTGSRKRQTVLYELYDRFDMNGTLPVLKQVTPRQSVVIFDFKQMALSLLSDSNLMIRENLTLPQDITTPHPVEATSVSEISTASWYANAHSNCCKNPNDVLAGIILFIDKAVTHTYDQQSLEPVMFSFIFFKNSVRDKREAWRPLGYIPKQKNPKNARMVRENVSRAFFMISKL